MKKLGLLLVFCAIHSATYSQETKKKVPCSQLSEFVLKKKSIKAIEKHIARYLELEFGTDHLCYYEWKRSENFIVLNAHDYSGHRTSVELVVYKKNKCILFSEQALYPESSFKEHILNKLELPIKGLNKNDIKEIKLTLFDIFDIQ